jgi:dihydrofolate synthase/folylpolyglutamate synthase
MVERGLRAAGVRTGRYTSPHLTDLEERFAIGGTPVPPDDLDQAIARVREAAGVLPAPPSYFEATTAAAFEIFRARRVDIAVLEVGLGGRLDATNIVDPVAAAITAVDFDHQAHLGVDLAAIAREKAGIVRGACPVVLAANPAPVVEVVATACRAAGARLINVAEDTSTRASMMADGRIRVTIETPEGKYQDLRLGLRGRHQVENAAAAARVIEALPGSRAWPGLADRAPLVRAALEDVDWPCRLELRRGPTGHVLIDGAHNPAGARALTSYLDEIYGRRLPMVIGIMRDKSIDEMLAALLPAASHVVFTAPGSPRAADPAALLARAGVLFPDVPAETVPDTAAALARAAALGDPVVVCGSLYLAGDIRPRLP